MRLSHPSLWWGHEATTAERDELRRLETQTSSDPARHLALQAVSSPPVRQNGRHYYFIQNLDTGRITRGTAGSQGCD